MEFQPLIPLPLLPDPNAPNTPAARLPRPSNPATNISSARGTTANSRGRAKPSARPLKRCGAVADLTQMPKKRGRSAGAANYSIEDIEALLGFLEDDLPLGGKGWNEVADLFAKWAEENGRPVRSVKSLETKFKQVRVLSYTCFSASRCISSSKSQNPLATVNAHPRSTVPMQSIRQ